MMVRLLYALFRQWLSALRQRVTRRLPLLAVRKHHAIAATIVMLIAIGSLVAVGVLVNTRQTPSSSTPSPNATASLLLQVHIASELPIVLYLRPANMQPALPENHRKTTPKVARIESVNGAFSPQFQVVAPSSTIELVNGDSIPHNTHVFRRGDTVFNVALPLRGVSVTKTLTGTGIFAVRCDLHPTMHAWLFAPPSEHYAVMHEPGDVTFSSVASGDYLLHTWRPQTLESVMRVSLRPGEQKRLKLQ